MAIDEPEEDFFDDSQYQHSQIPFTQLEEAALATVSAGALSRSSSFTTKTPTTEPSPVNDTPHRPKQWSFTEVAKKGNWTFCFDICHRDILNIKADSLWAASLGNRVAEGLRGRTIAPHMVRTAVLLPCLVSSSTDGSTFFASLTPCRSTNDVQGSVALASEFVPSPTSLRPPTTATLHFPNAPEPTRIISRTLCHSTPSSVHRAGQLR